MSGRILVVGWKPAVEDALDRAGIPHATLVEMEKYAGVRTRADADRVLLPCGDITNIEALLGALHRSQTPVSEFVGIWTAEEFAVVASAVLAQILGLRTCYDVPTALAFRDKAVQKLIVAQAGLPVARTALLACPEDLGSPEVAAVGLPAVLKPVAGAGTSRTYRVDAPEQLAERFVGLLESDHGVGPFLLESFVPGREMHLDGILAGGRLTAFAASRYYVNLLEIHTGAIAGSCMLDPERDAEIYARTEKFALACLEALGLSEGPFHMEVFSEEDGLSFSECGARAGGGGIIEVFEAKFGLHLIEEGVRNAARLAPGMPVVSPDAVGYTMLRARPGTAVRVPTVNELLARPGVMHAKVELLVGEPTPDMTEDTIRRAASAILSAPTEDELAARIEDLRTWFADAVTVASP
ncbi:acetyl-CoA carboxylase biotin carboxylase subunit family protein [Kitasatospora sp. NPDC088783]|uniref:ATP-grasp domain-containing protein n=1 Tax=Kitasatospora sp. NPDC088783 TaxID=3364077 RepID=UPI003821F6F3